ncbi:hypothetical protein GPECTOR_1640g771 [Gonium pectorale]|uniref:SAM domain-containing protein n=1 Tax=Gonium pectorale TaxID=33097 RepID=A0A150FTG4_GONPE|nr:hypothetical protein GPECTOR_1640g771 [Gonium pectorale]|eukprot:KXZ40876.1 hypothetical protein GPECTOR_1640g771 [Gonium pectorale]
MNVDRAQPHEKLIAALDEYGADLTLFEVADVDTLWRGGYRSVRGLQTATRQGLTAAGLPPGIVDHILALQAVQLF